MAASLICCGVEKCGSPPPKSPTSMPCPRSLSASATTAIVAEGSIRLIRSVSTSASVVAVVIYVFPLCLCVRSLGGFRPQSAFFQAAGRIQFFPQLKLYNFGHQPSDRASCLRHFSHEPRTPVEIFIRWHHKARFQRRLQLAVHKRHLQLIFVIADCPNASQHANGVNRLRIFDHQTMERIEADVLQVRGQLLYHLQPLGHAKHRSLLRVAQDGDDQLLKNLASPLNQIEVPVGWRIKRTGIDGDALVQSSSREGLTESYEILCGWEREWQCRLLLGLDINDCHPERSEGSGFLLAPKPLSSFVSVYATRGES